MLTQKEVNMIEEIIENFRNYMKNQQLTQQQAADKIHISRAHLSRILNGERIPSMALLNRMENVIKYGYSSKN